MSAPADERKALRNAVGTVLTNAMNFPEKVQSRILGQSMGPLIERVMDAVEAAGFRRQGPITDTQVEAAAISIAYGAVTDETRAAWGHLTDHDKDSTRAEARAALEAARDAGSNQ